MTCFLICYVMFIFLFFFILIIPVNFLFIIIIIIIISPPPFFLFFSHTLDDNRKKATSELTKILDWLHANRLSLNINKTNFTIFGPQCSSRDYSSCTIRLNGQDIKHVNECKFLGIYLDTHLTWKRHIEKISSKISSAIFAINRAKDFLSKHAVRCLYFALVHSHLTYGIHICVGKLGEH